MLRDEFMHKVAASQGDLPIDQMINRSRSPIAAPGINAEGVR